MLTAIDALVITGQFFVGRNDENEALKMTAYVLNRVVGFGFALSLLSGYFLLSSLGPTGQMGLRFDEEVTKDAQKSSNLASDIRQMWKTVAGRDFPVSPVSAVNAASRVFESVQLVGRNTNEVFALLGHNKTSSDSGYNFPFLPAGKSTIVYRFDCGSFGWQFDLNLDSAGIVTNTQKRWIH